MSKFKITQAKQTAFGIMLLAAPNAFAITTDRPDVAESSETVPKHQVQLEVGGDLSFVDDTTTLSLPTKVRVGILDNFELHVESPWVAAPLDDGDTVTADIAVGGKVHLFNPSDSLSVGVLSSLAIPTEGSIWSLRTTLAADGDLTDRIGYGFNVSYLAQLTERSEATFDSVGYAAALGFDLIPTLGLGIYGEGFGEILLDGDDHPFLVDGGVVFSPSDRIQFDAYLRRGVVNSDETGVGVGVGILF